MRRTVASGRVPTAISGVCAIRCWSGGPVGATLSVAVLCPQSEELKDWMALYADLPEAESIYDMMRQRLAGKLAGVKPPARTRSHRRRLHRP